MKRLLLGLCAAGLIGGAVAWSGGQAPRAEFDFRREDRNPVSRWQLNNDPAEIFRITAGDRIELTQEALAALLGVQRTTINAVAGALQEEGLITIRRGRVIVLDRARLKRQSCECYEAVEKHFARIIGEKSVVAGG